MLSPPNCAHWPCSVRPDGYYFGAVTEPREVFAAASTLGVLAASDEPRSGRAASLFRAAQIARIALCVLNPAELDELMALPEDGQKAKSG